jgi:hypothetical protein
MKEKNTNKNSLQQTEDAGDKDNFPGEIVYPASEDIYSKSKNETDIDPEDTSTVKQLNETYNEAVAGEKEAGKEFFESYLDIPGSELDDDAENIGSEDEENNYYSIGLDNHNELDENNE